MASVTLPRPSLTLPAAHRAWPADARARWALRLGLAAPLIGMAVWAHWSGFASTSHRQFAAQADAVRAGGASLSGLGAAYPPAPTLLAGVVPGGTLGLSVVASLLAAITLHMTWAQLVRRGLPAWLVACLLLPLIAVPAVAYLASQSVAGIATLSLLAVALQSFVWFTVNRDTEAGFVTGLALAAAFTFDPIAVFYALALGVATAFVARERFRGEAASAVTATVAVILFPTLFAVLAWTFLEWRFAGVVFDTITTNPGILTFPGGMWAGLVVAGKAAWAALLHVPLYLAVGLVYAMRRPVALIGYAVAVPASVVAMWVGLRYTPVTAYVLFTLVALTSVPRDSGRRTSAALAVVALAQLVLAWMWPPSSPGFTEWLDAMLGRMLG